MREYHIAAIPGDGIGKEVIAAGLQVLEVLAQHDRGFKLHIEHFPWSSAYYQKNGYYIPEGGLDQLRKCDAIFFGAVGAPDVPGDIGGGARGRERSTTSWSTKGLGKGSSSCSSTLR